MKISIYNKLKKQLHRDMGYLQDEVTNIMTDVLPDAILHGGTSIWRCYNGNRFSEDLDYYLPNIKERNIETKIKKEIENKGLSITKYKETNNVVFSKINNQKTEVRLEIRIIAKNDVIIKKAVAKEYEKIDGSTITIQTLSPEDLFVEKTNAFLSRRLIRDIYDVYFLSNLSDLDSNTKKYVSEQLSKFKESVDESNLKTIIISGIIPTEEQMVTTIKRKIHENII